MFTTHWLCIAFSVWPKLPDCLSLRVHASGCLALIPGICCLYTGMIAETISYQCNMVKKSDSLCFLHCVGFDLSCSQCAEKGCMDAPWCKGAGRCVCCCFLEQSFDNICRVPKSCGKVAIQACCCDVRCAIPNDE